MTTRDPLWNPNARQPAGVEHWKTYLRDPLHGAVGDVLRSLFPTPAVLGETWPVVYAAGKVDVSTTATRGAIVEDADGKSRLVMPTVALGAGEWFEQLAGSAGFADVWFPDAPGVTYYVSLRYEKIPVQARTLGEPSTTGALAEYRFDVEQERIGRQGTPDLVTEPIAGQLQFRLDSLIGPSLWAANPAKTKQVVIWKVVPATGGAQAVAHVIDAVVEAGPHLVATVPHVFGQTAGSASLVGADYGACVLGPVVETVDPSADPRHVLLATVTTGVVDTSVQNVVDIPEQTDDRLDELEAWIRGYQNGPAQLNRAGAMLGNNADMAWNNIVLTEPGGGIVKAAFASSPFAVSTGAWLFVNGHFLFEDAAGAPDWLDYQVAPGVNPVTRTICVEAVDETSGATAKWAGRLTTHNGDMVSALTAGKLPLIWYTWDGAAITSQTVVALRIQRGERQHDSLGGDVLYMAEYDVTKHGSLALRCLSGAGAGDKGTEQLCLLNDDDDDTAAATVAFERMLATLDALPGHVLKVAAQANAAAQVVDAQFAAVQLGGAGDLDVVGRSVTEGALGTVRRVSVADATNPLTEEIAVIAEDGGDGADQIPALSGKHPVVRGGDFAYLGAKGKLDSRRVPLGNVGDGWRTYDNATTAMILGPWVYGTPATGGVQPVNADVGNWWWLWFPLGGVPDPAKPLYIELAGRYRDYFYDCDLLASNGNDGGDSVVTWSVVRVADDGTETEWVVSKGGAGNDWLTNDIAEYRRPSEHGKQGADYPAGTGADWVADTHLFHMEIGYRWFVKFTPSVTLGWNKTSVRGVIVHMRRYEP